MEKLSVYPAFPVSVYPLLFRATNDRSKFLIYNKCLNSGVPQNHTEVLLKHRLLVPTHIVSDAGLR